MNQTEIGSTDILASVIGLGTWAMGGYFWGGAERAASIRTIECALESGINLIDTAPVYGFGEAEEILGSVIQKRRDKVVLSTKCGLRWDAKQGAFSTVAYGKRIYHHLSKDRIRQECEESLRRLRTDYIDIYHTHWPDRSTPIDETMDALLDLKKAGKIRAIGVSNVTSSHLHQYFQAGVVDVLQAEYSLLNRSLEQTLLPICVERSMSVLAYSPLAQGLLTGKMRVDHHFNQGDMRAHMSSFSAENLSRSQTLNRALTAMAQQHGVTQTQLVIAWTLNQPGITHLLCGMRHIQQVSENVAGAGITLSDSDLFAIRRHAENAGVTFGVHV